MSLISPIRLDIGYVRYGWIRLDTADTVGYWVRPIRLDTADTVGYDTDILDFLIGGLLLLCFARSHVHLR